jgi:hypothetical protein
MDDRQRQSVEDLAHAKIKEVVHTATILHTGWEMDNEAWIVDFEDDSRATVTTNHGGICQWSRQEAEQKLAETEASAASIRKALELWPDD